MDMRGFRDDKLHLVDHSCGFIVVLLEDKTRKPADWQTDKSYVHFVHSLSHTGSTLWFFAKLSGISPEFPGQ